MTAILLSSNPDSLQAVLAKYSNTGTVEAEYGDRVVEGSLVTLAHHGPRKHKLCPCLQSNYMFADEERLEAIGISHFDLDTLGGVLALLNKKPADPLFWELAAFVDIHGSHKIGEWRPAALSDYTEDRIAMLHAWWARNQALENKIMAPKDGSVIEISEAVERARQDLLKILAGDPAMMGAGRQLALQEHDLNKNSFLGRIGAKDEGGLILRKCDRFVNHLYSTPQGRPAEAVVALNTKFGSITLSFADTIPGLSARLMVQALWGPEAGGHDGIAGSPRDKTYDEFELQRAAKIFADTIAAAKQTS